ncbi:MAG: ATP-binding cassette domain-containing protein [Nakamurella multipartita]
MPENAPAIDITGLTKSFGDQPVLRGVDLTVATGTVCALLGPNGSGKTTIVNILSTLLPADGGTARIAGYDVSRDGARVRAAIGVTGQFSAVDNLLTGAENLRLMADLRRLGRTEGQRQIDDLLNLFDLREAAGKPASTYSGGMKRKLDLAMTLVARPRVLFLDEPTTGLDPRSRRDLWAVVRSLVDDGVTILLTTQYLDEADRLAHRVAVLDQGRIVAHDEPARLKQQVPGGQIRLQFATPARVAHARLVLADEWPPAERAPQQPAGADTTTLQIDLPATGTVPALRALLDRLDDQDVPVDHVEVSAPDLDDVFFALTSTTTRKAMQ